MGTSITQLLNMRKPYYKIFFYLMLLVQSIFQIPDAFAASPSHSSKIKAASIPLKPMSTEELAQAIGWINDSTSVSACQGYYEEPFLNPDHTPIKPPRESQTQITGQQGVFRAKGVSTLKGHVVMTQPGRQLTADKAEIYRDPKSGEITRAEFFGHVVVREPGKILRGEHATIYLQANSGLVEQAIYRITPVPDQKTLIIGQGNASTVKTDALNAWGRASAAEQIDKQKFRFYRASYTTCPPGRNFWRLQARQIKLDDKTGFGSAYHATLRVHGLPLLYLPYVNFPINRKRKSGILIPNFGNSSRAGRYIGIPIYWNMAPNYDMTLTPIVMTKRGVLFDDEFRLLTKSSRAKTIIGFIPQDREFQSFQNKTTLQKFPGNSVMTTNYNRASLRRLKNANDNRLRISIEESTRFNPYSGLNVKWNYVSDDYYPQDLVDVRGLPASQLPRQGDFYYNLPYMQFNVLLRSWQTLYPINQPIIAGPYNHLPEVNLNFSPPGFSGFEYGLPTQFVYFDHIRTPGQPNVVIGQRYQMRPFLRRPFKSHAAYFIPRIQLDVAQYDLINQTAILNAHPGRIIPMFDASAGLHFVRDFTWNKEAYKQTLEPELYYLYVPFYAQRDMPLFDTYEPVLTVPQLLSDNRYSGLDRIGDANQLTFAITSRALKKETGDEKFIFQIGQSYYFANRRVTLCQTKGCSDNNGLNPTDPVSPVLANAQYALNQYWSINGNIAWYPIQRTPLSQGVQFHFQNTNRYIFNMGYQYSQQRVPITVGGVNVDRTDQYLGNAPKIINISTAWPVPRLHSWSFIGYANYDIANHHAVGTMYGLEYDNCCWGVRMFANHTFQYQDSRNQRNVYNNTFYFQVVLKGLGVVGNSDPSRLLTTSIAGFKNTYQQVIPKYG